jgi:hypothetical protein
VEEHGDDRLPLCGLGQQFDTPRIGLPSAAVTEYPTTRTSPAPLPASHAVSLISKHAWHAAPFRSPRSADGARWAQKGSPAHSAASRSAWATNLETSRWTPKALLAKRLDEEPLRTGGQRRSDDNRDVDIAAPLLVGAERIGPARVDADERGAEHIARAR